ncbi:MAG: pentapeptide repeat-containing protein [Cyanobacteria bacterium]|nr:pentapeptide repeat-containing protein [Cyanobacteriota bacterium]MDA0867765.1 pentapeptide repeat-containing protein [Cyanobacteriota bacterium]
MAADSESPETLKEELSNGYSPDNATIPPGTSTPDASAQDASAQDALSESLSGVAPLPQARETVAPSPGSMDYRESFGQNSSTLSRRPRSEDTTLPPIVILLVGFIAVLVGLGANSNWLTLLGSVITLSVSWRLLWPSVAGILAELSGRQQMALVALPAFLLGCFGFMRVLGVNQALVIWARDIRWEIVGALGDFLGAIGQILVAMLALYVAWRQYVISRDLTTQQNRITQQQTIDAYFQGISGLVLDDEGLLEDWPQERIIAEARTAAILSSVDAIGKAKVIQFLSRSKLLAPLQRDRHLGRPILDGEGGYAEDRAQGVRVINLGAVLANTDLSGTDLRWTDLSEANLVRANLARCDLVKANLTRTILYYANLSGADLMGAELFQGSVETASPRSHTESPDYQTGTYTGAVVEGADFSNVQRLSESQRQYCCRWGGETTRKTIPGGCKDTPNCLGR